MSDVLPNLLAFDAAGAGGVVAVGFVTPAFAVAGAVLAVIPIAIHLLNRRRYRTMPWAAMDFLRAALRRNHRRMKFEQWTLLVVRCAVLALLGVALARPMACEPAGLAQAGARAGLHVLLIDNSLSMAYLANRSGAASHLDQAKVIGRGIIERLTAGTEAVAIVTAAAPAHVVLQPTYDLAAAGRALDRIDQTASHTDLVGALSLVVQIGRENVRQPFRRLDMITDAGRSGWETAETERLASLGQEISQLFQIRHFNVALPDQWNAAPVELAPQVPLVRAGFRTDLLATV
ncbi:MAG: BatA domain-containing protein, partial [Phycisphaerales bacterium]|nr:BatA domain-containing protein [Phycisphaerales bacterium]